MTLVLPQVRDRRAAAADETVSVAGLAIYGAGSRALTAGADGARGVDRPEESIRAIVLHQTWGRAFLGADLPSEDRDAEIRSRHRVDRITAHFVVLQDGVVLYTHDIGYILNDAGGRRGIDIEFAGRFGHTPEPRPPRLSPLAIRAGRKLVKQLARQLPGITHIHPHGQVQRGGTGKFHSCPGPDIWMNVGEWAVAELGLLCEPTGPGYLDRGISEQQRNEAYRVDIRPHG